MLTQLVGQVDANAALVLIVIAAGLTIVVTSLIVKRRSRTDISNEFELAKMKQDQENNRAQYSLETQRSVEFKKIDQGLITSHRAED